MTAFDIVDNNLDFDSHEQPKEEKKSYQEKAADPIEKTLTASEVEKKWNGKIYGQCVYIDNVKYIIPNEQIEKLKTHSKYVAK